MTVAAVFRVPLQMVLMLLCTPDVIRQRQHFHNDFIPVLPAVNKGSCFFQMSGICAVKPRAILFSNINALFVQAVRVDDFKQMLHKLCNTGTFLIKDHFNALCVSIIRAVQRVCCSVGSPGFGRPYTGHRVKKCWTPQRHPPAMYTVSILLTFLLLLVQFASMLCTPYGFLASCKSIHHTNSQKVLPHHCRVIIILLKAISLIKWDRFRIRRHNFRIQKILIETHDPFHQLISNVLSLISRVHQKIMQKCDCFSIIKRANQPDQLITIPRRNNSCGIVHRTDKFFGIIAGFPVNG